MSAVDYLIEQLAAMKQRIAALEARQVGYVQGQVTTTDGPTSTFAALLAGQVDDAAVELAGIVAPPQFLPDTGDTVTLALAGAQPIYQPGGIAENAVGTRELDDPVLADMAQTAANATAALQAADGKSTVTFSPDPPPDPDTAARGDGDIWFQRDSVTGVLVGAWRWDGTAWSPATFGDQILASLTAAKITTGTLAAGTQITVGEPTGEYTLIAGTGVAAYAPSPNGSPAEIARLGRTTGGRDPSTGTLTWYIGTDGVANLTGLAVSGDPVVQGVPLSQLFVQRPGGGGPGTTDAGATHWYGYNYGIGSGSGSLDVAAGVETGLIEMAVTVTAGRTYWLVPEVSWRATASPVELQLKVKDGGTSAPTLSSPQIFIRYFHQPIVGWDGVATTPSGLWTPSVSGVHRLLLVAGNSPSSGGTLTVNTVNCAPTLNVIDLGPSKGINASVNTGGAGAPPPTQQYYHEFAVTDSGGGWATLRGNGSQRTDTTDVIQGQDPSGFNGNGWGKWWFNLASGPVPINSAPDRVQLYVEWNWTYYNSGGTAVFNMTSDASAVQDKVAPGGDWQVPLSGKAGSIAVDLPSTWWSYWGTGAVPRAVGITAGPGPSTDEQFYVRFTGASMKLRVWWTQ